MQKALEVAKKLEGKEIMAFSNNIQSNEVVEEELDKTRRSLGIKVKNKMNPSTSKMMPTPSAASSS